LIVVDMQVGLLAGAPKHALHGVIDRINQLSAWVRARAGHVIFVQHSGRAGDDFEPGTAGWALLAEFQREQNDTVVRKTLNDPFIEVEFRSILQALAPARLLITGWATDFCVDATVRSAVSQGHEVVVVADGHTLSDRPHLDAESVIRHHHWIWRNLITRRPMTIASASDLITGCMTAGGH
jgi:nicotinamidase-related amidase